MREASSTYYAAIQQPDTRFNLFMRQPSSRTHGSTCHEGIQQSGTQFHLL